MTIVTLKAPGLTMEHVKKFYAEIAENQNKMSHGRLVLSPILREEEGTTLRWARMKPPKPMSPRSFLSTGYDIENADGSFTKLLSTRGNEALYAADVAAKKIKKSDVPAFMHLDYSHWWAGMATNTAQLMLQASHRPWPRCICVFEFRSCVVSSAGPRATAS